MKTFAKTIFVFTAIMVCFSACGSGENSDGTAGGIFPKKEFSAVDAVKIEDIDWEITQIVDDGMRQAVLNMTNNTDYTIFEFSMKFKINDSLTDEQMTEIFGEFLTGNEYSKEYLSKLPIQVKTEHVSSPGETVQGSFSLLNYISTGSLSASDIFTPDIATIFFAGGDDKGHYIYYDFINDTYSESSDGAVEINDWPDGKVGELFPRIPAEYTQFTYDFKTFSIDAYGVTPEYFEAYKVTLRDAGFDQSVSESTGGWRETFSAEHENGCSINVTYDPDNEKARVEVNPTLKPEYNTEASSE